MKKIFLIFISIIFALQAIAFAVESGVISASATASKTYKPEVASISVAIVTKNIEPKIAAQQNKKLANKVITALKKQINCINGDFVKTTGYSLEPHYSYHDKKRVLDYYNATHNINVETTQIDNIGKIIDTAVKNGANKVNNIYFKLKNTEPYCSELLKQASIKAKEDAQDIVFAMNSKIQGIKKINYHCSPNNFYIRKFRQQSILKAASSPNSSPTQIEHSNIKLNATVNAEFYIKNK